MPSVLDYEGRQVDLLAFHGVFPARANQDQLLAQQLVAADGQSYIVAGIQRMAQNFVVVLCTRLGSKPYRRNDGTTFMTEAARGLWRTTADVEQSFYASRLDVRRQLIAAETDDTPADEKYDSAELTGVTLSGDRVSLKIKLTSRAGTSYTFITPIAVSVR